MFPGVSRNRSTISSSSGARSSTPLVAHSRRRSSRPTDATFRVSPWPSGGPASPPERPQTNPSGRSGTWNGGNLSVSPGPGATRTTGSTDASRASASKTGHDGPVSSPSYTRTSSASVAAAAPSSVVRPEPWAPRTTSAERPGSVSKSGSRLRSDAWSGVTATSSSGGKSVRRVSSAGSVAGSIRPVRTTSQTGTGRRTTHSDRGSAWLSTASSPRRTRLWHALVTSGSPSSQASRPMHGRRAWSGSCSVANRAPYRMSSSIRPAATTTSASCGVSRASGPSREISPGPRSEIQEMSGRSAGSARNRSRIRSTTRSSTQSTDGISPPRSGTARSCPGTAPSRGPGPGR